VRTWDAGVATGCELLEGGRADAAGGYRHRQRTFLRTATSVQSNAENSPPHTAKDPPSLGATCRTACGQPASRRLAHDGAVQVTPLSLTLRETVIAHATFLEDMRGLASEAPT
jgi:hypothetical protein